VTSVLPACPLTVCAWWLGFLTLTDLWGHYLMLGGTATYDDLAAYLRGTAFWSVREHNVLAQALNEHLWDLGLPDLAPLRRRFRPT
jgi:hypothetical protein